MIESQLNVAFGYLSTLLGYLCLDGSIRETFMSSRKSLKPLLESLQEFIQVHQRRNTETEEAGMGPAHEMESISKLQSLVNQLESAQRG